MKGASTVLEETQKPAKATGRYRKVEVRTWGDEKFRSLSPMQASGQGLWLFLITGPHTGPIPGLFRAGRAAMAEELDWDVEAFDKAFQEVFQQGMVKADFKARVMWIPKAISHNKPESPNVVRSWATEFDLIPECDLKREAFDSLKASIHALGEAYGKAFNETFGKAYGKPLSKAMPNQEQEQEQKQEQEIGETAPASQTPPPPTQKPEKPKREQTTLAVYLAACKASRAKPIPDDHHAKQWANDAGISTEMLQIAWVQFRDRYTTDEKAKGKRYKDWPGHFANAIKSNWFKLWFMGDDGRPAWTSTGLTHKAALDTKQRREATHA